MDAQNAQPARFDLRRPASLEARFAGLRDFFVSGATRPLAFRKRQLGALRTALVHHEPALLGALHADLHKPPQEAYATEVGFVQSEIDYALRHLTRWARPARTRTPLLVWPAKASVCPEPYGVVLVIGPWNYPLQLLLSPLIGAIAAGNCACLKPSELAPATSAAIAALVADTFPAHYITAVEGPRETSQALLELDFDYIFFTGSAPVGRAVMTAAARHLTPVTLELGGKSPCIVCADTDLDVAARRIVWGKFTNAGQTCVAPDFVLVDERAEHRLLDSLQRALAAFYGSDPRRSRDYGRIVNPHHFNRLVRYLNDGRAVCGGQSVPDELYIAPTILTQVDPASPVMQEEIFGP
ncbi:MAG: aldehyde dehydrogenase family protein, partial [Candidatus Hydrogenedentes bacterium]|nr:aldehyde dehydrogenase family protein [Candidatus Hydrogenedentota bacterium]